LGYTAFAVRILAWGKGRGVMPGVGVRRSLGGGVVLLSLVLALSGHLWQPALSTALLAPAWSAELELWLPFWPFEPFLPLLIMALGVWTATAETVTDGSLHRAPA
jgi:hypothetical protein